MDANATEVSAVTVTFGRAEQRIGKASAASEGSIAGADLTIRPLLRTAEILESVPGMMVTQHSGSGKANQYFLRGFNLDHGTDFAFSIDDMPMNLRTHGHGQGYLDVNGLIPEAIERIDYRKGSYRADAGDFSLVGLAAATTVDRFERPFAAVEAGSYGWRRFVAGASLEAAGGTLLLAADAKAYDGPWQLPEHSRPFSVFGKYRRDTPLGVLRLSLSSYASSWRPTEQIPQRAIGALVDDAYGSLDLNLQGRTEREIVTARLDGDDWRVSAYVQHYDWALVSNFTYFLDDPVNGDEVEQAEKLWTYGGRLERRFTLARRLNLTLGAEGRYDAIGKVGLYSAIAGQPTTIRSQFAVGETSGALYVEASWRPIDRLTLMAGARGDRYGFDVRPAGGTAWAGKVDDALVSPKLRVTFDLGPGVALYGNWGRGFHSNDARGVTAPTDPAPGLVAGTGKELGGRFERDGLVLTANSWWMEMDSELIYVGDTGSAEPSNASKRRGYEATLFWRPRSWLAVDGVWTWSHARFKDSPGLDHVPGALETAGELGVSTILEKWNAALRIRHLGGHPLTEDNTIRSLPSAIVNLRAAWTPDRYELYGQLLNVLEANSKDIEYYYESYLPAIDLHGPVEDILSRAVEPRTLRVGLKVSF